MLYLMLFNDQRRPSTDVIRSQFFAAARTDDDDCFLYIMRQPAPSLFELFLWWLTKKIINSSLLGWVKCRAWLLLYDIFCAATAAIVLLLEKSLSLLQNLECQGNDLLHLILMQNFSKQCTREMGSEVLLQIPQ